MLTGKMVRVRFARDRLIPLYLDVGDAQWLQVAEQLIELFRGMAGQTRGQLDAEVGELFGDLPQPQIHQGLAKLLEDRCDFEVLPGHPPEQLREAVFLAATAARKSDTPFDRTAVLRGVAEQLKLDVPAVEAGLFADLKSEQRLVAFKDTTPRRLLERYNVALVQAILLRAARVEVEIRDASPARYRQLFRQIKFHRLICDIDAPAPGRFRLRLDGPLSLFSATQKYGLQLALFLPSLILCEDFELKADVRWGVERRPKSLMVSAHDGLVSHQSDTGVYVPPEVQMFVDLFRKKIADWDIDGETDVVPVGDGFWVPDFRLTHKPTRQTVALDVLGFWRRSSLERHLALLRHADRPFLLALSDQMKVDEADLEGLPGNILRFRNLPLPDEVARRAGELLTG
jgi:predicted nuclease of restriction endonuclease-like RecB superfamily